MIAVILAAGRGTRMGSLTATTPKPLLTVQGEPILARILRGLQAAGVTEVVVITGYRAEQIEAYLGDGSDIGLTVTYRRQRTADGSARALLLARDAVAGRAFVLSWGDVLVQAETYASLWHAFEQHPCDALLTVNAVDDPWRGAAVYVDAEWRVRAIVEKPPRATSRTRWNNAGIFVLTSPVFAYAESLPRSARGEYELPQAIAAMIADGYGVRAHAVGGYWSDLGTPEDLAAAEHSYPDASPQAPRHGHD